MRQDDTNKVTLDNCHEEPIHIPGGIQSHGYLIVLNITDLSIRHVSVNISDMVEFPPKQLIGKGIGEIFGAEFQSILNQCSHKRDYYTINPYVLHLDSRGTYDIVINESDHYIVLDIEPKKITSLQSPEVQYYRLRNFMNALMNMDDLSEILDRVAREVRGITGFDRVMVYKFDTDNNGEVIAEAKKPELNSFLQQHFPESDIPAQARALYIKNRIRILANVDDKKVPLYPDNEEVDLSGSILRSVSPIHCQYLRNMGVAASMSISVITGEKLWGLIACHHNSPYVVPFHVRESIAYLGLILSHFIGVWNREQAVKQQEDAQAKLTAIFDSLSVESEYLEGLRKSASDLQTIMNASGMAWCLEDNKLELCGKTPTIQQIKKIYTWYESEEEINTDIFHTHHLSAYSESFKKMSKFASGVLVMPINKGEGHFLMWFREELIHTKNWGGKPEKIIEFQDDGSQRLMPRTSFKLWKENVRYHSIDWSENELLSALKLRNILINYVLQRSQKLGEINRLLEEMVNERTRKLRKSIKVRKKTQSDLKKALLEMESSNQQLEQFAYIASHDLQEPLRKIQSFGSRIQGKIESYNDPVLTNYFSRMISAAERMQKLIKDLLSFSRVNRMVNEVDEFNLNELVDDVISDLNLLIAEASAQVIVGDLGAIKADKNQIYRVFQNLIQNALKFAKEHVKPVVKIGVESEVDNTRIYKIVDNGIGFDRQYKDRIFELFQRLHGRNAYEGTGLGLAICKKIMERHGGEIWADSTEGEGTTIFLKFKINNLELE